MRGREDRSDEACVTKARAKWGLTQTRAEAAGMARVFESARQAQDAHWPHEDYFHEVLSAEQGLA
jgi:hypothetical protein